jgi:hypothetical protein
MLVPGDDRVTHASPTISSQEKMQKTAGPLRSHSLSFKCNYITHLEAKRLRD